MMSEASKQATQENIDPTPKKELAIKRIPVTPSMWAELHGMRQPGESYDDLLNRILDEASKYRLMHDLDEIEESGDFIPLEDIDKPV